MFHTTVTFLMFLFSMNSPMDSKFVISSKAPAIYIIFIWFLSCLNCLMILWMTLPKWFVTILIFLRFSPVWILWWTAKFAFTLKALPHIPHLSGFSPIWTLWWIPRLTVETNALPHTSHIYGFSPVWILQWRTSFAVWLKSLMPHITLHSFFPVWIFWWTVRLEVCHIYHIYMVSRQYELSDEQ